MKKDSFKKVLATLRKCFVLVRRVFYKVMLNTDNLLFGKILNKKSRNMNKRFVLRRGTVSLFGVLALSTLLFTTYNKGAEIVRAYSDDSVISTSKNVNTKELKADKTDSKSEEKGIWKGEYEGLDVRNLYDKVYTEDELYTLRDITNDRMMYLASKIPYAKEIAGKNGLYPSIMMAQSILESDWGTSELTRTANNFFGIKAKAGDKYVERETLEDSGGENYYKIIDKFTVYDDPKQSFEANAFLLKNGDGGGREEHFYRGTWVENTTNYKDATKWLTGRYATDDGYERKLNEIIETYNLNSLDPK